MLHCRQRWVCTLGDTLKARAALRAFERMSPCKKRIIAKFKGKWWHSPVSRWVRAPWKPRDLSHHKAFSPLRGTWKGWRNCKRKKYISFKKLWTPYQWRLRGDTWFLMTRFLQRYSANRCAFTFQKGEKLLSFHSVSIPPQPPVLLLKVTFISKNVFLRVYLRVGLSQSDVTSARVFFGRLWKRPWETAQAQIGGFHVNERRFKQFSERFWERLGVTFSPAFIF